MALYEIPNEADATDPKQSVWDAVDIQEMNEPGNGVASIGGSVTADATARTVSVPTVTYVIAGQVYTVTGPTLVTLGDESAYTTDYEAFDLVVGTTSSTLVTKAGTAAVPSSAVFPALDANTCLIAAVWREEGRSAVVNGDIAQKQRGYVMGGDLTEDLYTTDTAGNARRIYGGHADGDNLELQGNSSDATDPIHLHSPMVVLPSGRTFTSSPASPTLLAEFEAADTIVLDYANVDLTIVKVGSTVELHQAIIAFGGPKLFWASATVGNEDGTAINSALSNSWTMFDNMTFQATNANHTIGFVWCTSHQPILGGSGGTMSVTQLASFNAGATLNAGSSVTTRIGLKVADATGAGSVTSQVGVMIDKLDHGTNGVGVLEGTTTVPTISGGGVYGGYFSNYLRVPTYTDGNRGTASNFAAGTMIFNTTSGMPEWSDGTNWVDATGATT